MLSDTCIVTTTTKVSAKDIFVKKRIKQDWKAVDM